MTTVNRNGGLGGLWPKFGRNDGSGAAKPDKIAPPGAAADSAHFSVSSERLARLAGGPAPVLAPQAAADLVRDAGNLESLIRTSLKRATGHDVDLGAHATELVRFVQAGLASSHLSFDEIKQRLG